MQNYIVKVQSILSTQTTFAPNSDDSQLVLPLDLSWTDRKSSSKQGSSGQQGSLNAPAPGEYKLRCSVQCYQGPLPDADPCDYTLDTGELFDLLESHESPDGTVRILSSDGWIDFRDSDGRPVIVPIDQW